MVLITVKKVPILLLYQFILQGDIIISYIRKILKEENKNDFIMKTRKPSFVWNKLNCNPDILGNT